MRHIKITSLSSPLIKEAIKEKKKRQQSNILIEGLHLLEMAIAAGAEVKRVFFTESFKSKNEKFLRQLSGKAPDLIETTDDILSRLSDTETPQGIVAIASYKPFQFHELKLKTIPLIVVADGIQDPGNLGSIIRTSDAAGADAVIILQDTCDAFMPKVIRSTAGSIFNIPIVYSNGDDLIRWLKVKQISLFVTDITASETVYEADFKRPLAFVFGNEAHGASEGIKHKATAILNIPILGRAESLNVASSAAICLYEAVRQRTGKSTSL